MFRDAVGGERDLIAGREILDRVASAFTLLGAHSDDERDLHLICLFDLIADTLAGEVDGNRDVFAPQTLCELYCVRCRISLYDSDHELGCRCVDGQKIVRFQKVTGGHVAHAESHRRNTSTAEIREKVVVTTAAEH